MLMKKEEKNLVKVHSLNHFPKIQPIINFKITREIPKKKGRREKRINIKIQQVKIFKKGAKIYTIWSDPVGILRRPS